MCYQVVIECNQLQDGRCSMVWVWLFTMVMGGYCVISGNFVLLGQKMLPFNFP